MTQHYNAKLLLFNAFRSRLSNVHTKTGIDEPIESGVVIPELGRYHSNLMSFS